MTLEKVGYFFGGVLLSILSFFLLKNVVYLIIDVPLRSMRSSNFFWPTIKTIEVITYIAPIIVGIYFIFSSKKNIPLALGLILANIVFIAIAFVVGLMMSGG